MLSLQSDIPPAFLEKKRKEQVITRELKLGYILMR
jgi:hypothetical protein